ncbi:MAG: hypothetical protein U0974_03115 [Gemmatimonadales bacterium]|nr:hypothetical protein [Gemmatimonadales bacterium]MDZ4388704.1 hypothetical protein [Gemmatimonadales bacterium]
MWRTILALTLGLLIVNVLMLRSAQRVTRGAASILAGDTGGGSATRLPTVYVIFQSADCRTALHSMAVWSDIHHRKLANVRGLLLDAPRDETTRRELLDNGGITFPVADADAGEVGVVLKQLGYSQSLVAVLVDPLGRVRLALPWNATDSLQVDRLLQLLEPTPS